MSEIGICSLPNFWHCAVKLTVIICKYHSHNFIHKYISYRYGGSEVSGPDEKLAEEGQELMPAPLVELVVFRGAPLHFRGKNRAGGAK
jgi:hypothetical protein